METCQRNRGDTLGRTVGSVVTMTCINIDVALTVMCSCSDFQSLFILALPFSSLPRIPPVVLNIYFFNLMSSNYMRHGKNTVQKKTFRPLQGRRRKKKINENKRD